MRFRQVHLDFHTSEAIDGIGEEFDKKEFQEALILGHVDSITVFAKCHHGWSYHPTEINKMHPHLKFDLLKAQIDAAHEIGVKAPIYLSAGTDERYAFEHPEDTLKGTNGAPMLSRGFLIPCYHPLCFNTKYLDLLVNEVIEVCEKYDPDGIFLDIAGPRKCYCNSCIKRMREEGYNPDDEKSVAEFGEKVYFEYTDRIKRAVYSVKPGTPIYHNGGATPRGKREMAYACSHSEIESLPTSFWGYDNLPLIARYVQTLGIEYLGMTGKFHYGWGEFGGFKHKNALIYETALSVSLGAKCSIGDQLHPRGKMSKTTYELIGSAYSEIEKREEWLDGVTPVVDIAVYSYEGWLASRPDAKPYENPRIVDVGAMRLLSEGQYLFHIVDDLTDLTPYKLVVLPDFIEIDEALKEKLDKYIKGGGKILATGKSALDCNGNIAFNLGAVVMGEREIHPMYLTPAVELPNMGRDGYVIYEYPTQRAEADDGAEVLSLASDAYFNRTSEHFCSHLHAPESPVRDGVAMTLGADGGYAVFPLCLEYAKVGSQIVKQMFIKAVDSLLGDKKTICAPTLPAQAHLTLMDQTDKSRYVVHAVYAPRNVKGSDVKIEVIEDAIPLYNTEIKVNMNGKRVTRVYSAPSGEELAFTERDGFVSFTVPSFTIHGMAVIDYAE